MDRAIDILDETETVVKNLATYLSESNQTASPGSRKRPPTSLPMILQKLAQSKTGVREAALSEINAATQRGDPQAVTSILKRLEISERSAEKVQHSCTRNMRNLRLECKTLFCLRSMR